MPHLVCFMVSVSYAKHSPVAFFFKGVDSPRQSRVDVQLSHPYSSIDTTSDSLVDVNLCRKTRDVVFP